MLNFDRRFTQRAFNQDDALSGNAIASFLLGAASGGAIDNNFYPTLRWNYYAPWFQDDWRVTEPPDVESRASGGISTHRSSRRKTVSITGSTRTTINPVSARIQQRVPGYTVRGGLGFVDVDGNSQYPYQFDKNNIQPRVGFAYALNDRTIARGGYGLYYVNVVSTSASNGFGVNSFPITSLDGDRTLDLPADESVPGRAARGAGIGARHGDVPRPQPELLEHRFRQSVRAPVLAGRPAAAAVADDGRAELRGQPHEGDAEPVGRLQRAAALAARSLRSHQGRVAGVLQRAAAEPVLRRHRLRRDRRASPARRCRATS